MPVTLRVSSHQRPALGPNASRVFERGGTIGRLPGNDWILPDPEKIISGHHAEITLQGGTYFLTDRSTNGTVVNGREIPRDDPVPLRNGDVVTIGAYDIEVVIEAGGADGNGARAAGSWPAADDDLLGGDTDASDPLKFFEPDGDWAPPSEPPQATPWDHAAAESGAFVPPPVSTAGVPEIPEDWDQLDGADDGAGFFDAAEAFDPVGPTPSEAPSGLAADAGGTRRNEAFGPFPSGPGQEPLGESRSLEALFRAAGIDPAAVDERTLAALGEILHVVVEGLIDVLRARAEIKNQFRVPMTILKVSENNPLKFSPNANEALFNLFGRRNSSFTEPVEAFREAFADLRAHQFAMLAGMRSAFDALLKRFDPDGLQESFDRGMKRAALLDVMNKTRYWELYREMYAELGNDDATFRRLFGDEFAQAYEAQMQRLSAAGR